MSLMHESCLLGMSHVSYVRKSATQAAPGQEGKKSEKSTLRFYRQVDIIYTLLLLYTILLYYYCRGCHITRHHIHLTTTVVLPYKYLLHICRIRISEKVNSEGLQPNGHHITLLLLSYYFTSVYYVYYLAYSAFSIVGSEVMIYGKDNKWAMTGEVLVYGKDMCAMAG